MASGASASLARQLGALFEGGSTVGLSDRQLIERFAADRGEGGETAFAALVARHGPMVLGICRQLLGDHQHAEDAFQAVFLVLARKARSLREPDLLGNWLYGVALRTAAQGPRSARPTSTDRGGRRPRPSGGASRRPGRAGDRPRAGRGAPPRDRPPAGCLPPGGRALLLRGALARRGGGAAAMAQRDAPQPAGPAREKLRRGLLRRGVVLSTTAMAAALAPRSASASVSPLLCDTTTRAAIAFAARHAAAGGALTAPAAVLAQEVLRTMLWHKLRLTTISLFLLAFVAAGAGWLARPAAMGVEPQKTPAATRPPAAASPDDAAPRPAAGRMTVVGRVLDPAGKSVPSASVMVYGALKQGGERPGAWGPAAMGQAAGDGSGRYRLDMPRISSSTHHIVGVAARARGSAWAGSTWMLTPISPSPMSRSGPSR